LVLALCTSAVAQDVLDVRDISFGLAAEAAVATMQDCRNRGFQVSVAVVDRGGILRVLARDDGAGIGTADGARRKAFTAVTFRGSTLQLAQRIVDNPTLFGLGDFEGVLALGGGLPISAGGEVIGGIGVSGAPGADIDEICAQAGINQISDRLQ
jgi:uncharacterized protein GlcG (DUF336 family)